MSCFNLQPTCPIALSSLHRRPSLHLEHGTTAIALKDWMRELRSTATPLPCVRSANSCAFWTVPRISVHSSIEAVMATAASSKSTGTQPSTWHTRASWEELVAQKKASLKEDVPEAWRLPEVILQKYRPSGLSQPFILCDSNVLQHIAFLSEHDIEITENNSATQLIGKLSTGELTALEVTTAFCKRAAVASQLVSFLIHCCGQTLIENSYPVSQRLSTPERWTGPNISTITSSEQVEQLGLSMACQSVSKTASISRASQRRAAESLSWRWSPRREMLHWLTCCWILELFYM